MEQLIFNSQKYYQQFKEYLLEKNYQNILLVCGKSFSKLEIASLFNELSSKYNINIHKFDNIKPNPLYEGILEGLEVFRKYDCDCIITVGGGSPMDTAKCIKMFARMNDDKEYLKQEIIPNDIPFIAVPTTAGTGSEATRYAIIYYNGEKTTVTHESCIPSVVLFDPSVLKTLSLYQKKATMMDALNHAIESYWAVKANDESKQYADKAIRLIVENIDSYLLNDEEACSKMLEAAYLAGKAINITQTTAGHAMCYKITTLYGLAHGHSVSLVMSALFPYVLEHLDDYNDPRGKQYLIDTLKQLAEALGYENINDACSYYLSLLEQLQMGKPQIEEDDLDIMVNAVNPDRLNNNPVKLNKDNIKYLYKNIFNIEN